MSHRIAVSVAAVLVAAYGACSRSHRAPKGPPPEYQRPDVQPWDAGQPVDPLNLAEAQGEWVDDEPALHGNSAASAGASQSPDSADVQVGGGAPGGGGGTGAPGGDASSTE